MGMLERIAATLGYTKATVNNAPAWLQATAEAEQFTIPERTLPEAQAELYQRLSWVQIAVSTVARVAATTKFSVVEMRGDDAEQVVDHEFEKLLRRPNPLQSRAEFLEATFSYFMLTGNFYWWLNRASATDKPQELWLLPSHKVKPIPDRRLYIRGYEYTPDGAETAMILENWEVCHGRRFHPLNSFVGLSPIEALATVATGDMAMQKWNTNYFGKDNAKIPGALAFADPVDDVAWAKIKKDTDEKHGGTKRRLMMLRNVGKGGVEWLPMAMSQNDMQFLEGRSFNKEEIYSIYAPGLASLLAVNATEANSVSGKKTFIEFSVWPQLVQVAEKISNDILPIYGEQYNGEFEDIRITDRSMDLAEQSAFAQVHTIDEIRERFHKAKPLGDGRGKLLPAEVGKGMTDGRAPEDKPEPPQMLPGQAPHAEQAQPQDSAQPDNVDMPEDAPEVDMVAKAKEAKALRKWIKRRPHADVAEFDAEHLTDDEIKAIANELKPEGAADTDFFTKAIRDEDGDDRKRKQLELYHADKIERALRKWQRMIVPSGTTTENITPDLAVERMKDNQKILRDAIIEMLMDGAHLGAETGISQAEAIMGVGKAVSLTGVDWEMVNENVLQWVLGSGGGFGDGYGDNLTGQLARSTETQLRREISEWIGNGLPYNVLLDNLERGMFSRRRADVVATTEITRAYAEGNRAAWRSSGVIKTMRWNAGADERVCSVCGPLHMQTSDLDGDFGGMMPPAHPRCRCWLTPVADAIAPPTKIYDLSEGARVREEIGNRLNALRAENAQLMSREIQISKQINIATKKNLKEREGVDPDTDQRMIQAHFDFIAPLRQERSAIWERRNEITQDEQKAFLDVMALPANAQSKMKLTETTTLDGRSTFAGRKGVADLRKNRDAAIEFVNQITAGLNRDVVMELNKTGRAYALPGRISIEVKEKPGVIVHELGHTIEFQRDAAYHAKRKAFFDDRTKNDKLERFVDAFPGSGYTEAEQFKRDKWMHAYTGKVYGNADSSEVIAMGIQHLYESPANFINKDPEFFDFMVSYLRGTL